MNIEREILLEKKHYVRMVKERASTFSKVVIYGAGSVGQLLYRLLQKNGVTVAAFMVNWLMK